MIASEIISRTDAKVKGLTHYFTGSPCKHGHTEKRLVTNGACVTCLAINEKKYRTNNRERYKENRRKIETKYRQSHRDKLREKYRRNWHNASDDKRERHRIADKKWREANPEKVKERIDRWRSEKPEMDRAKGKRWRDANPDKIRKKNKTYKTENSERLKPLAIARVKKWVKENPEKHTKLTNERRARKRNSEGSHTGEQLIELFDKQNWKCIGCDGDLRISKSADHIFALAKGGSNWIWNIQWLCIPCNSCKHDRHPLVWLCEIVRLKMTTEARDAKIQELADISDDRERLEAYHRFVKQEWQELTSPLPPETGASHGYRPEPTRL